MRVLAINVWGIPGASTSDLVNANVIQDYDAVVVYPKGFSALYDNSGFNDEQSQTVTSQIGRNLANINDRRREELRILFKRAGVVVCFMLPMSFVHYSYKYTTSGAASRDRTVYISNYDWLFTGEDRSDALGRIQGSKGTTIENINPTHPFSDYLNTKPAWSAYVDINDCEEWRILASAFGTYAIALDKRVELGHIILLPSNYYSEKGRMLERCMEKLLQVDETTPPPNWVKDILVPGEQEIINCIVGVDGQISSLEKEREAKLSEKRELERWKYLLYKKGKHHLEPVVRDALKLIGCDVEPQPDKDSNGLVVSDHGTALIEVGGSKGTIRIEKLGELTTNMGNFMSEKKKPVKGILIGNPFCELDLDDRPPKRSQKPLFAKELLEGAQRQGITVLLSTDLYQVVISILSGKFGAEEKQSIRQRIFEGSGLVMLAS
jgi:hypothetical protein